MGIAEKLALGLGAKLEGNSFDTTKEDKGKAKLQKKINISQFLLLKKEMEIQLLLLENFKQKRTYKKRF